MKSHATISGTMKAVIFKNHRISIKDVPVPDLKENEALVNIQLAGICSTDSELYRGYYDFEGIPGHEFIGKVFRAPSCPSLEGRRVVADINCGCGNCHVCKTGDQRHCRNRSVLGIRGRDGVFAEYCAVPLSNLHPVPQTIENFEAVFAEPLAAVLEITKQLQFTSKTRVAVLGDGKLGVLCALTLKQFVSDLTLIGRHSDNLKIVSQQGIQVLKNKSDGFLNTITKECMPFDVVIEATGDPEGINHAISLTRPQGTIVVKTTVSKPSRVNLAEVVVNELHLIGSRCGDMASALSFMENKHIDFSTLVEATYPLSDFKNAFEHANRPGSRKILVKNLYGHKSQT